VVQGKKNQVTVKIPPGIISGKKLRLTGKGDQGIAGQTPGDLYLMVHVKEHPVFKRVGDDIYIEKELKLSDAVFGTTIEVQTLKGEKRIKIPPGIQGHTKMRLKNCGMPLFSKSGHGDAYVKIVIKTPQISENHHKKLFEALAKEGF
jgi:curved DNA-binding protein